MLMRLEILTMDSFFILQQILVACLAQRIVSHPQFIYYTIHALAYTRLTVPEKTDICHPLYRTLLTDEMAYTIKGIFYFVSELTFNSWFCSNFYCGDNVIVLRPVLCYFPLLF